jgi:hypothetical protein
LNGKEKFPEWDVAAVGAGHGFGATFRDTAAPARKKLVRVITRGTFASIAFPWIDSYHAASAIL